MTSPSNKKLFVYQHLAKLVTYHPLTGLIYWKEKPKGINVNWHSLKPAGWLDSYGYRRISRKQGHVLQHNLAWFIIYGKLPNDGFSIDHKNDRKADNRIENLRLLSDAGQSIARLHGSNLPPWVYFHKGKQNFRARIKFLGKRKHLGSFNNAWQAHLTVADFAIKNGLISADEYALLISEWKEFRGGKNG